MENGHVATITSGAIGLGTIAPNAGPGPVSFDITATNGQWGQLFVPRPVRFTRSANPLIASHVEPA